MKIFAALISDFSGIATLYRQSLAMLMFKRNFGRWQTGGRWQSVSLGLVVRSLRTLFTTGNGAKKSKRLNAIVALKRAATALQYVYVIGLAHKPLLFLVANLRDFSDKTK